MSKVGGKNITGKSIKENNTRAWHQVAHTPSHSCIKSRMYQSIHTPGHAHTRRMQQVAHAPSYACPSSHQALHARASTRPRMLQVMHTLGACNRSHTYWVVHARARTKRHIPMLTPGHTCPCLHQATHTHACTKPCMPVLTPGHACLRSHQAPHARARTKPHMPVCALAPRPRVH